MTSLWKSILGFDAKAYMAYIRTINATRTEVVFPICGHSFVQVLVHFELAQLAGELLANLQPYKTRRFI